MDTVNALACPRQVYRVGTSNVPRSFETTPWSGCYGCGFDIGTSGGIGVRASSLTSDNRCASQGPRLHPQNSHETFLG